MKSYVYIVTNKVNEKKYVGKANNVEFRWKGHIKKALKQNSQLAFHCAIRKHGKENFDLHIHSEYESEPLAFEAETQLIKELNSTINGYNMNEGGMGGINPTQEVREKISKAKKGQYHTDEVKKHLSDCKKGVKRCPHSEETKAKMRATREKMRLEGRNKFTEEQKQKLRDSWANSPERKPWNTGTHGLYSEEYKKKISKGHKGIPLSDAHKEKLRKRLKKCKDDSLSDISCEESI